MTRGERAAILAFLVMVCITDYFYGERAATSFMVVLCFIGIWTLMEDVRSLKRALKVKEEED